MDNEFKYFGQAIEDEDNNNNNNNKYNNNNNKLLWIPYIGALQATEVFV
jgi:hypothetical protein